MRQSEPFDTVSSESRRLTLSPAEVHPLWSAPTEARRLDPWGRLFGGTFEVAGGTSRASGVRESFEQQSLGALTMSSLQADTSRLERTVPSRSQTKQLVLCQPRTSECRFRLTRVRFTVQPRDCVLLNAGEVLEIECPRPMSLVALTLPEPWLRRWLCRYVRGRMLFVAGEGWSKAVCAVMSALSAGELNQLPLSPTVLAENIGAILALAAGPQLQRSPPFFQTLMETLHTSLDLPDLRPAQFAERHNVSVRALHYAFAAANTTFTEQLMRLRLERAREILRDTHFAELPVAEVALRCGFMDPSHFARRFRQRFGETPVKFRRSASPCEHSPQAA